MAKFAQFLLSRKNFPVTVSELFLTEDAFKPFDFLNVMGIEVDESAFSTVAQLFSSAERFSIFFQSWDCKPDATAVSLRTALGQVSLETFCK